MSQNFTDTTCVNINENDVSSRQNEYVGPRKQNFLYKNCYLCISIFRWFPVLFIFSVTLWSYYAYIYQLCIVTIESTIIKSSYMIVFNFLYFMTLWSYFKTVFTKSSIAPSAFRLKNSDYDRIIKESTEERKNLVLFQILKEKQLTLSCRTFSSSIRLCSKCNLIKPDRAHHCSICNACVLKMDHHCPWLNNCVSFSNYKYFILFLGYSFLMCLFGAITSFPYFLLFWSNQSPTLGKFNILFLFFVSIMFSISLFSLFFYHIYLVLRNLTTLENFRTPLFVYGPNKNAFNLGKYNNFKEVFGEKKLLWFLPVYTSLGDGIEYPCSDEHAKQLTQRLSHLKQPQTTKIDNTDNSFNENTSPVKSKNEFTNPNIEEFAIQIPGTTTAN